MTGASGFIGRRLTAALAADGVDTLGITRARIRMPAGAHGFVHDLGTDDAGRLAGRLRRHRPDAVFHLAGPSSDGPGAIAAGAASSLPLFEACLALPHPPVVIAVSSSAVYGAGEKARALDEHAPLAPHSYYAVGKILQEALARRAALQGLPVVIARLFNVIGAGQSPSRVPASFVRQLASQRARGEVLHVRNLDAARDFVDVHDAVRALRLLAERGAAGETYNVCSGKARRVGDVLDKLIARSGAEGLVVEAQQDADVAWQQGDGARLRALGWKPIVPIETTLDAILTEWRGGR